MKFNSSLVTTTVGSLETNHKTHLSALYRHIKHGWDTHRTNSLARRNYPLHHQTAMTPCSIWILWPCLALTSGPAGVPGKTLAESSWPSITNHPGSKDHIWTQPRPAGPGASQSAAVMVNTRCGRVARAPGLWEACGQCRTRHRVRTQSAS